ncbi:selenium cofactor biosynthesis protein YqeC [Lachnospiraceae bacterium 54-53]
MGLRRVFACEVQGKEQAVVRKNSLWEALGLSLREHMVIAFTGGGGKTSAMFSLADELSDQGKRVIVTTSTHIFRPKDRLVVPADHAEAVKRFLAGHKDWSSPGTGRILVTGRPGPEGKLKAMDLSEMEKLSEMGDVLLVEADGAKRLPLKIPGEGEPVLLKGTHAVIGCAGLDCIGRPWEEKCFRWELVHETFGWHTEQEPITPGKVARILISGRGTRKGAESMEYRILLNKADDEERLSHAAEITEVLGREWARRCVITSFFIS